MSRSSTLKPANPAAGEKESGLTTINKEAADIRYRTAIHLLNIEACSCGRTHVKMSKVLGRSDDK